jgi:hypothetical protein
MTKTANYNIMCYLGWCGAEATFPIASLKQYQATRAFLDKIGQGHRSGDELGAGYGVNDYYFIEKEHREAFQKFMRNL